MTLPFIEEKIDPDRWEPPTMNAAEQLEGNPLVTCTCGRSVSADMMRFAGGGWVCDGCLERSYRTGERTREDFARSQGAPDIVIRKAQELDAAQMDREFDIAARSAATNDA